MRIGERYNKALKKKITLGFPGGGGGRVEGGGKFPPDHMIKSIVRVSGKKSPMLDLIYFDIRAAACSPAGAPEHPELHQGGVASVWKTAPIYPRSPIIQQKSFR